jgi:hypothetical protein
MSTKTTIVLELTEKEAQALRVICGSGIAWGTPHIGKHAQAIWSTLADLGVRRLIPVSKNLKFAEYAEE